MCKSEKSEQLYFGFMKHTFSVVVVFFLQSFTLITLLLAIYLPFTLTMYVYNA